MNRKIHVKLICALLVMAVPVFSQYEPPNGTENYHDLLSPSFYAEGGFSTNVEGPQAGALNPAVSGNMQLPVADFSYLTLADLGGTQGWGGHFVNIGALHPTKIGVIPWSTNVLYSNMASADLGFVAAANLSFAKDLNENLMVGIGIGSSVGTNEVLGWSLTGDLGILHYINSEKINNLRWAVVLRDFGKGYSGTVAGKSSYPTPFSIVGGIGLTAIDSEAIDLDLAADLSLLQFQNVRLGIGLDLKLFDLVGLQVTTTYDLVEMTNPAIETGSFIPSFGLSFDLQTAFTEESDFLGLAKNGRGVSNVKTQIAAGPVAGTVWGFGAGLNAPLGQIDTDGPVVTIQYPTPVVLSVNGDDIQDATTIGMAVSDDRYVYGYEFAVKDSSGSAVKNEGTDYTGPDSTGIRLFFDRLFYAKQDIDFPSDITWDGKDNSGNPVADGKYQFSVTAWDDNGNRGTSDLYDVYVDSTHPSAKIGDLSDLDKIFSPNNDGNKDTLSIAQSGSSEDVWIGEIFIDNDVLRTFTWENQTPEDFIWDGVTDDGTLATDGVYGYRLSSTDRGGNSYKTEIGELVLNTQTTSISLSIDKSQFSPNGDGKLDDVTLTIGIPIKAGISEWDVKFKSASNRVLRSFSGTSAVPDKIVFDGKDETGKIVPEGDYTAAITVTYINGNVPTNESPSFTVDITPPEATVTPDLTVFSPNGDGNKDIITFFQETSVEEEWKGQIYNKDQIAILTYTWRETADSKVNWDGHALGGLIAPDGSYSYKIYAEDAAGNAGESREVFFEVNTEATTVFLSREFEAISPNSDSTKDSQRFFPQLSITEGIDTFFLRVLSENDVLIRSYTGRKELEQSYEWEGLGDEGSRVPDGIYYAQLEIRYENGNKPIVNSPPFIVDTSFPRVTSEPDKVLFSPNGDGKKDTVTFRNSSSTEDLWEARIVNTDETVVRRVFWKDTVSSYVWDGSDDAGNRAADGTYFFEIFTTDVAGNSSIARSAGVELDTRTTSIIVTATPDRISPNGDGVLEEVTFNTLVNEKAGVTSWKLAILRRNGAVVREFEGNRIPEKIVWNGRNSGGEISDGEFYARFDVVYAMGNTPTSESDGVTIDTSGPETSLRFDPRPFSPDDDGFEDRLEFQSDVSDSSQIATWNLTILDPKGKLFKNFQGTGRPPRRFYWDGLSDSGELVQAAEDYPYEFYVEDNVGNGTAMQGTIPIDVLVIRDGDRLKIRISNITFEPNSPSLETDDSEVMEKNSWVLGRIADIFKKYASYFIRIEGHAVSVYWANEERAATEQTEELVPLSRDRAQTVKDALVRFGIDGERIQVEGIGGAQPIVPHSDLENRWKNRRVEFILLK